MRVMAVNWQDERLSHEQVMGDLMQVVADIEVHSSRRCFIPAQAPTRFYGSEWRAAREIVRSTASEVVVGCANDRFTAQCAARVADSTKKRLMIVPSEQNKLFVSRLPVGLLDNPEACEILEGLGIATLGDFAALSPAAVRTRFGIEVAFLHELVRGRDKRPMQIFKPQSALAVVRDFESPSVDVEGVVHGSHLLVSQLCFEVEQAGVACLEVEITLETEHDEINLRRWRAITVFDESSIVERIKWQLEQWLREPIARPSAGVSRIKIEALHVVALSELQSGLWGELSESDQRAHRGLDRIRGLVGVDQVLEAGVQGGRYPRDRTDFRVQTQVGESGLTGQDQTHSKRQLVRQPQNRPWPGKIPAPSPTTVHTPPIPIDLLDSAGKSVEITSRGNLSGSPAALLRAGKRLPLTGWAGPWLSDSKWWSEQDHQRCAWFQMLTADGQAYLCRIDSGGSVIEASYG